ncbi:hypothetical protein [Rhodoplanes sp. SY1]|uniref:hypothetical protein n=1 Tax=Rhodoplanes sp. SY1 TaxID=3166646 RepID=UPI0038B4982E
MRTIQVSTDVFAAIWKARREGEQSENDILVRVFGLSSQDEAPTKAAAGFREPRYNVDFPEGFEIFRSYSGHEYRARATRGSWKLLKNGENYPSLNELSRAIGTKTENAWKNWFYNDAKGNRAPISNLRDESKIVRRSRSKSDLTLEDLDL